MSCHGQRDKQGSRHRLEAEFVSACDCQRVTAQVLRLKAKSLLPEHLSRDGE